jgi:hypothetical protein
MDNFIFKPNSLFNGKSNDLELAEYYTFADSGDFIDTDGNNRAKEENDSVVAKKTVRKNGSIKYTIRLGNDSKLYNTASIYDNKQDHTFLDRICRSNDRFKEVNLKVFNLYLQFLKTNTSCCLTYFYMYAQCTAIGSYKLVLLLLAASSTSSSMVRSVLRTYYVVVLRTTGSNTSYSNSY